MISLSTPIPFDTSKLRKMDAVADFVHKRPDSVSAIGLEVQGNCLLDDRAGGRMF